MEWLTDWMQLIDVTGEKQKNCPYLYETGELLAMLLKLFLTPNYVKNQTEKVEKVVMSDMDLPSTLLTCPNKVYK